MIIFVPGDPVGKQRPRMVNGHVYTPKKTKEYEDKIAWEWKRARGPKLDGPIRLRIVWHCRIPKSVSKAKRAAMNSGQILPIVSLTAIRRYAEITGIFVEVEQENENRSKGADAPETGRVDKGRN